MSGIGDEAAGGGAAGGTAAGGAAVGMIWAQTPDGVIGADRGIPWRLPEDMAHFKAVTLGHPVVMGRRTWDSLPPRFRPLSGRRNLVVTRDPAWAAEGAERAGSVAEALERAAAEPGTAEVWVIGGGEIYRAALAHAAVLWVTDVDVRLDGDTYAPEPGEAWAVAEDRGWRTSERAGLRYRVRRLVRR